MSKVSELKQKYSADVNPTIFESFVVADTTETKKYLEFMCKLWANRSKNKLTRSQKVIEYVKGFEAALPYLTNKDIYSPEYQNLPILVERIESALEKLSENSFEKEKHGLTLDQTDNYLLIRPLTKEGSNKWGANTRWCTTSKNGDVFSRYFKSGFLVYLIDKKSKKFANFNKIAFYIDWKNAMTGNIDIFDQLDRKSKIEDLMNSGWHREEVIKFISLIRVSAFNTAYVVQAKKNLEDVIGILNRINIVEIKDSIDVIKSSKHEDDLTLTKIKNNIDLMVAQLKSII